MADLEDEVNEILEIYEIDKYQPLCENCKHWKKIGKDIGECNSKAYIINPVYTRGHRFFCSDFYFKKQK